MDDTTKQCRKCLRFFPRTKDYFYPHHRMRDGFLNTCKECRKIEDRERYAKRPSGYSAAQARIFRIKNPESVRRSSKRYTESHKDQIRESSSRREKARPGHHAKRVREWRRKNPDKNRAHVERRRSRRLDIPATLTYAEWEDIKASFNYSCAYCGRGWHEINGVLTQEHVIPVCQGGSYTKDNIVPACQSCNSKKGPRTPEQAGMILRKPNE